MADAAAQDSSADDPEPVPPTPPSPNECCQSGCIPCVYDMYNDEMETYREALRAWRARHPGSS
ncbi:oxidoreductase-like domain-containing protein [Bordetella tumbae]|uniref:oxidoreductase-like domain-containing protein n=1 Tax=Bordetella tumbae TaxID=1649139 RepID=UPI0039EF6548